MSNQTESSSCVGNIFLALASSWSSSTIFLGKRKYGVWYSLGLLEIIDHCSAANIGPKSPAMITAHHHWYHHFSSQAPASPRAAADHVSRVLDTCRPSGRGQGTGGLRRDPEVRREQGEVRRLPQHQVVQGEQEGLRLQPCGRLQQGGWQIYKTRLRHGVY